VIIFNYVSLSLLTREKNLTARVDWAAARRFREWNQTRPRHEREYENRGRHAGRWDRP